MYYVYYNDVSISSYVYLELQTEIHSAWELINYEITNGLNDSNFIENESVLYYIYTFLAPKQWCSFKSGLFFYIFFTHLHENITSTLDLLWCKGFFYLK